MRRTTHNYNTPVVYGMLISSHGCRVFEKLRLLQRSLSPWSFTLRCLSFHPPSITKFELKILLTLSHLVLRLYPGLDIFGMSLGPSLRSCSFSGLSNKIGVDKTPFPSNDLHLALEYVTEIDIHPPESLSFYHTALHTTARQ